MLSACRAAVDDVETRDGQRRLGAPPEIPEQRLAGGIGGRARRRHRDTENRVGAESRLVGSAVELDKACVETLLVGHVEADKCRLNLGLDIYHRLSNAFPAVSALLAIS